MRNKFRQSFFITHYGLVVFSGVNPILGIMFEKTKIEEPGKSETRP